MVWRGEAMRVVIDTNVVIAGLRCSCGASHAIIRLVFARRLRPVLSVPLVLEHEEVMKRTGMLPHLEAADIEAFLDGWCACGIDQPVYFGWRPVLNDPDDDMLLELAVAGGVEFLITSNVRDFRPAERFRVAVVTPAEFVSYYFSR